MVLLVTALPLSPFYAALYCTQSTVKSYSIACSSQQLSLMIILRRLLSATPFDFIVHFHFMLRCSRVDFVGSEEAGVTDNITFTVKAEKLLKKCITGSSSWGYTQTDDGIFGRAKPRSSSSKATRCLHHFDFGINSETMNQRHVTLALQLRSDWVKINLEVPNSVHRRIHFYARFAYLLQWDMHQLPRLYV